MNRLFLITALFLLLLANCTKKRFAITTGDGSLFHTSRNQEDKVREAAVEVLVSGVQLNNLGMVKAAMQIIMNEAITTESSFNTTTSEGRNQEDSVREAAVKVLVSGIQLNNLSMVKAAAQIIMNEATTAESSFNTTTSEDSNQEDSVREAAVKVFVAGIQLNNLSMVKAATQIIMNEAITTESSFNTTTSEDSNQEDSVREAAVKVLFSGIQLNNLSMVKAATQIIMNEATTAGVNLNTITNEDNKAALQAAIATGNEEIVGFLIDQGANPMKPFINGNPALQEAIATGNKKIVDFLIDKVDYPF